MTDTSCCTIAALRGPVPLSHLFLRSFVREGDSAIDATCGNGNDTVLLARLVGVSGHVWGFDIQPQAIRETGRALTDAGVQCQVTLLQLGHEKMAEHVTEPVQVVLFNLGYLPGGDRTVITRPETTGRALVQSLVLLAAGGIVVVTVYPGHSGGEDEQSCVESWVSGLDSRAFDCWRMAQTNVRTGAPYLLLVQKAL